MTRRPAGRLLRPGRLPLAPRLTPLGAAPADGAPRAPGPPPPAPGGVESRGASAEVRAALSRGAPPRGRGGRAAGPGWRGLAERHRAPGTRPRTASDAHSLPGLARGSIRSLPAARSAGGSGSGFQTRKFQGLLTTPGLLELGFSRVPAATLWGDRGRPRSGSHSCAPGRPPPPGPRHLGAEPPRPPPRPGSQVPEQWTDCRTWTPRG